MKLKYIYFLLLPFLSIINAYGQQKKISEKFKKETVLKIDSLLQKNYVFPDKAKLIGSHLKDQLKKGNLKKYEILDSFAVALTKEIRFVNNDKHLGIWPAFIPLEKTALDNDYETYFHNFTDTRKQANGFREVKIIEGNIGYLNIGFFMHETNETIDSYMNLLANTDAIIIDLRDNGGGSPKTVQYLCSYFLKDSILVNTLYYRNTNRKEDFFTGNVTGKKLIDVPLFILTSSKAFSGAEEFCYNMQTQKRATLIGETTAGAANPGEVMKINSELEIFIPTGTGINPITKTNWEGVGVIPEIKTKEAYTVAVEMAKKTATEYRERKGLESKTLYQEFLAISNQDYRPEMDKKVFAVLQKWVDSGLYNENDINFFGSKIQKNPVMAESVLKANTQLFPNSPIALLNYGDLLEANGKKKEAIDTLKRAVDLAENIKAPYLEGLRNRYEASKNPKN